MLCLCLHIARSPLTFIGNHIGINAFWGKRMRCKNILIKLDFIKVPIVLTPNNPNLQKMPKHPFLPLFFFLLKKPQGHIPIILLSFIKKNSFNKHEHIFKLQYVSMKESKASVSLMSQDASNEPPHGFIQSSRSFWRLMEPSTQSHWREEWERFQRCLEMFTHLYTMVEGMRGVQGFLENSRDLLYIGLYIELCRALQNLLDL